MDLRGRASLRSKCGMFREGGAKLENSCLVPVIRHCSPLVERLLLYQGWFHFEVLKIMARHNPLVMSRTGK